jgi:HTH-type transcriptional regulator/antitoxin HipB
MHNNTADFVSKLAEAIHAHRKLSGLTQSELAAFAGVGKTVIFDLEHGKSTVRLDTLLKVLTVLNIQLAMISPTGAQHA